MPRTISIKEDEDGGISVRIIHIGENTSYLYEAPFRTKRSLELYADALQDAVRILEEREKTKHEVRND